ncbi:MAG: Ig-like domain-containing protein [Buchananella hordeovulneris]|nr:Ig-like domain-containing protein [Buchananella hordeovulneris]
MDNNTYIARTGQSTDVKVRWNVAVGAKAGQTFTVRLPDALMAQGVPEREFPVRDAEGGVVAYGRWNSNQEVVFTYTDYVENHRSVWASFFQRVTWNATLNNVETDTAFPSLVFDGGCAGSQTLSGVLLGRKPGGGGVPGKVGDFPHENSVSYPAGVAPSRLALLRWGLYAGPVTEDNYQDTWVIEDKAAANQEFLCSGHASGIYTAPRLTYRLIGSGELDVPVPAHAIRIACDSKNLRAEVNPAMGGIYWGHELILQFFAKTTDGTKPGATYYNTATVNGTPYRGRAQRADFGAEGGGLKDGFGSLRIMKLVEGTDGANNARFTFNVSCSDGRKEVVSVEGPNTVVLHGILANAKCVVEEINVPAINGQVPSIAYAVEGAAGQEITVKNKETATITVKNQYPVIPPVSPSASVSVSPSVSPSASVSVSPSVRPKGKLASTGFNATVGVYALAALVTGYSLLLALRRRTGE